MLTYFILAKKIARTDNFPCSPLGADNGSIHGSPWGVFTHQLQCENVLDFNSQVGMSATTWENFLTVARSGVSLKRVSRWGWAVSPSESRCSKSR